MRETEVVTLRFPYGGQAQLEATSEQSARTTIEGLNMRAWDHVAKRVRGSSRPGITKFASDPVSGGDRVQDITSVVTSLTSATSPTSMQVRTITNVAVAGGDIRKFTAAGFTVPTNGTGALSADAPVIFSADMNGVIYFVDGTTFKKFTVASNTVATWSASAGSLPVNGSDAPRLIERWRGRIVLSGIKSEAHNWYMSAVDDATDFDYAPTTERETQAVAGNNSPAGTVGQPVTALIPFSDDLLIMGCDHSIWLMQGDPMANGRLMAVTDSIGIAWGRAWCKNSAGDVYFVGSRGGLFRWNASSSQPVRISDGRLDGMLEEVDFETHIVRLVWSDEFQGVHGFITPVGSGSPTVQNGFWYDQRSDFFCQDRYGDVGHAPICLYAFDGDSPEDRVVMLGCRDGYIRQLSSDATTDDGEVIRSYVWLGPIQLQQPGVPFVVAELQGVLSSDSAQVDCSLSTGDSAEAAWANRDTAVLVGSFTTPRSLCFQPRLRGCAAYVKLSFEGTQVRLLEDGEKRLTETGEYRISEGAYGTAGTWAFEHLQAKLAKVVTSRQRRA